MSILISGRAEFYDSSPVLTPEQAQKRFTDWFSGDQVLSSAVAVGRITPSEADEKILREIRADPDNYIHPSDEVSISTIETLQEDFLQVTKHDMARVPILGAPRNLFTAVGSGYQRSWHPERAPFVRWVVSEGDAGTEAAIGQVCKADYDNYRLETMVNERRLVRTTFPVGTVLRLMTGDIHKSPEEGAANRIFMSNTVSAAHYQR